GMSEHCTIRQSDTQRTLLCIQGLSRAVDDVEEEDRAKTQRRKGTLLRSARGRAGANTGSTTEMTENEIAKIIVDAAYKVHVALGPGLLESVYEAVLAFELERRALQIRRQQSIGIMYKTLTIDDAFRAGLVVEGKGI